MTNFISNADERRAAEWVAAKIRGDYEQASHAEASGQIPILAVLRAVQTAEPALWLYPAEPLARLDHLIEHLVFTEHGLDDDE